MSLVESETCCASPVTAVGAFDSVRITTHSVDVETS